MDDIILEETRVKSGRVEFNYELRGKLSHYFTTKCMYVEYGQEIGNVPKSILNISFVASVLPLMWLTDTVLWVDEIDRTFYDCVIRLKNAYQELYPQYPLKGRFVAAKTVYNSYEIKRECLLLFSGGIDAHVSYLRNREYKPVLCNIQGWYDDPDKTKIAAANADYKDIKAFARKEDVKFEYVKSNFATLVNNYEFKKNIQTKLGDSWWHGFQHGIGLIGHAAPLAFNLKLKTVYIASSYTKDDDVTCASSPTIDNNVEYACCKVVHDQYEFHRQEKITHICNYIKKNHKKIVLRVCWQSSGGENCCNCEKCYRTIFGIIAEGESPSQYGFKNVENKIGTIGSRIQKRLIMNPMICIPYWQDIQDRFIENKDNIPQRSDLEWIYDFDFNKINNTIPKKILLLAAKCRKIASKIKLYILR